MIPLILSLMLTAAQPAPPMDEQAVRNARMLERVRAEWGEPCDPATETGCTPQGVAAYDAGDCMLWRPEQPLDECMALAALIRAGGPPPPPEAEEAKPQP